jgi:hypothetical protein
MLGTIMKKLTLILIIPFLFSCSSTDKRDWTNDIPTFEDFKTTSFCNLTAAETRPKLLNTEFNLNEKNKIREGYLQPDNYFHCEYSIASFEKDNGEWTHVVIYAPSGQIVGKLNSINGILFSKASSLIIVNPTDASGNTDSNSEFWILEENELKKIK